MRLPLILTESNLVVNLGNLESHSLDFVSFVGEMNVFRLRTGFRGEFGTEPSARMFVATYLW